MVRRDKNNILRRKHFEIVNFQSPKGFYLYTWLMVDKKYSMASECRKKMIDAFMPHKICNYDYYEIGLGCQ